MRNKTVAATEGNVANALQADKWAKQKADLAAAATEQTEADIALVEATRAHAAAGIRLNEANARVEAAGNRLTKARAALGRE